jgi:broad specificity phosphatase PhoE
MIILMKTGPYDPQIDNISKYASVIALGRQESDPPLDPAKSEDCFGELDAALFESVGTIYCSDLLRTRQTAELLKSRGLIDGNTPISYTSLLREIRFDIADFCSEAEYTLASSDAVRAGFIRAFIDDSLLETRQEIKQRCDELLKIFEQNKAQDILAISHTFFLKLFTIYLEHRNLFDEPELITRYIEPQKRIMKFCEQIILE